MLHNSITLASTWSSCRIHL